jgi:hypothetical protein
MSLLDEAGSEISLAEAKEFIKNYSNSFPTETTAYLVNKVNVMKILNQDGCVGIKIYNGYDAIEQQRNLVLIGVDAESVEMDKGVIIERLYRF